MDNVAYPLHLDGQGRFASADADDHVREMIYQVLFTNPGERVNRPDFGCGLLQLVFMPASDILAATTEFLVRGALQRWLADIIDVVDLHVTAADERLLVDVTYIALNSGRRERSQFLSPWAAEPV